MAAVAVLALTSSCDTECGDPFASASCGCTADADCVTASPETLRCNTVLGVCEAEECANDLDCKVLAASYGSGCESSDSCEADDACVEGFEGEGFCLTRGDAAACDLISARETATRAELGGGAVDVCVAEQGGCSDGACDR